MEHAQLDGAGDNIFISNTIIITFISCTKNESVFIVLLLALSAAIINMVPWGGPMARTASVIGVDNINDLWYQVIPLQLIGIVLVVLFAMFLGMREKRKIARTYSDMDREKVDIQSIVEGYEQQQNENSPIIGEG